MIDALKLDLEYNQQGRHTCVLASYAVVHHYFTGLSVSEAFKAYCEHHGLAGGDYEELFARHSRQHHAPGPDGQPMKGTERIVRELHERSMHPYFRRARAMFQARVIDGPDRGEEHELLEKEALMSVGVHAEGQDVHVITAGAHQGLFVLRDTNESHFKSVKELWKVPYLYGPLHRFVDGAVYSRLPCE